MENGNYQSNFYSKNVRYFKSTINSPKINFNKPTNLSFEVISRKRENNEREIQKIEKICYLEASRMKQEIIPDTIFSKNKNIKDCQTERNKSSYHKNRKIIKFYSINQNNQRYITKNKSISRSKQTEEINRILMKPKKEPLLFLTPINLIYFFKIFSGMKQYLKKLFQLIEFTKNK